jgi:hypothetical protein
MRELIQVGPRTWRFVDLEATPPSASPLPCPHVISDEMPPTEQVDGRFYTSKSRFRAVGRALGLSEVGTEKLKPKTTRASDDPAQDRARTEAIGRAAAQHAYGRRPKGAGHET